MKLSELQNLIAAAVNDGALLIPSSWWTLGLPRFPSLLLGSLSSVRR